MVHVQPRRKASDLYVLGIPLTLDDGATELVQQVDDGVPVTEPVLDKDGTPMLDADDQPVVTPVLIEEALPPVVLWVAKLSDIEMTIAMKKASRAQATVMAGRKDHESEDWQATRQEMSNLDRETWLGILTEHELLGRREVIEARVAGETVMDPDGEEQPGEWAKDGYLEGLRDAWLEGLNITYAADPGDPEAVRVLSEIERFNVEVERELEYERGNERSTLESLGDDQLLDKVTELMLESEGQAAWADEYRLRCIFLASRRCDGPDPQNPLKCLCRGDDRKHRDFHFDSYEEVCVTDGRIRTAIYAAFNAIMVDVREGKGSAAVRASSVLSALLAAEATSSSSGQEASAG